MKQFAWLASLALVGVMCAVAAPPTDNPAATLYGGPEGYPGWTAAVNWANVIDMAAYRNGATCFERFENARDVLSAKGGGVLYYPAGTYDFSQGPFDGPNGRGLMLKPGVVIRGAAPVGKADPSNGKLDLPTKFVFGFKDRSNVAVDTGTRGRFLLRGAMKIPTGAKPANSDVVLSIETKNGALGEQAEGYPNELVDAKLTGKVAVKVEKDPLGKDRTIIEAELAMPAQGDVKAIAAKYILKLYLKDGQYTGEYEGFVDGVQAKGSAVGKVATVRAETPRDWNIIGLCPLPGTRVKDVNNVGICYVHMVGATVYFGPDIEWGPTWALAGSWKSGFVKTSWQDRKPDGTHPADPFNGGANKYIGAGSGRLVLGCVLEDACVVNDSMTCGVAGFGGTRDHAKGFGQEGFYMQKFAARIAAYGSRVLVAGNVIPPATNRNFKYVQTTTRTTAPGGGTYAYTGLRKSYVLFDYGKICGIDINKEMLGLTKETATGEGIGGYLEPGVIVRDNYVFNNGHKGYNLSGSWLTIANNKNDRDYLRQGVDTYGVYGWRLTLDGFIEANAGGAGNISDNLARAFDLGGSNVWVDRNWYTNCGSDPGNDGEGILCQAHGGTQMHSWAITRNEHVQGIGEISYIGGWTVRVRGSLMAWNKVPGWVGQAGPIGTADQAIVANEGKVNLPKDDTATLLVAAAGVPVAPTDVKAEIYKGDAVMVTWVDASDNEIGFRVDRSFDGGKAWTPIAYRPPHIQGAVENPQAWADFSIPAEKPATYRVVALTAKDDGGISPTTAPVTVPQPAR